MMLEDTVAAIATPAGMGAVAMVRISGHDAVRVAERVFEPRNPARGLRLLEGYSGALGRARDADGAYVDDVVAFVYRAPRSYTGEDVAELCCHGGAFAAARVLRLCLEAGARAAKPGEFTRRAFLNGKMDLTQAEAVMNLVGAQGNAALRAALAARDGALSREADRLCEGLLAGAAQLAAWSDYPDEDLLPVDTGELAAALGSLHERISALLSTCDRGRILHAGASAAIVGKPNVGKSTLMNLLAGDEVSIVSETPGTTRDVVRDVVGIGGVALNLMDTAGLREAWDDAEAQGVERSLRRLDTADLVIAVFDCSGPLEASDRRLLALLEGKNRVAVLNKADLPPHPDAAGIRAAVPGAVSVSAKTGEGREALEHAVAGALQMRDFDPAAALVAGERQRGCLMAARDALSEALRALNEGITLDAVSVCVDAALDGLLSLTGRRVPDAVVDEVFSRFCVGK